MNKQSVSATAIQSLKADGITLSTGEDAWQLLSNASFLANWDTLYDNCPWATIFQHQSFVVTWYQSYRTKFQPVIIKAEYGDQLTGLLTLAVPAAGNKGNIVGAGYFDAEYHTWLTDPADKGQFIKTAFSKLLQLFPQHSIYLRFIPPHTPIQWMQEPAWKKRCVCQAASRPLMNLNDPEINKVFRKDDLKLKLNRLKKLGEVTFEQIKDTDQFASILNELTTLYDFRQGAMFNKNQFRDDHFKKDFILALFEQNLLHVTVLRVNGKIFASISAVCDQDWVYLSGGFNVHAPFHAKRTSPGFVSFMLLGQKLISDGKAVLDLTPGGDFYKERLATRHEPVCELIISNNPVHLMKRRLRKRVYAYLAKTGKWPMGTELTLRKRLYLLKGRIRQAKEEGLVKTLVGKIRHLVQPPKTKVFSISSEATFTSGILPVFKNDLNDLLCYEAKGALKTRWEFLEDAMRRLGLGETCFTYCKNGRLLYCIWHSNKAKPEAAGNKTASSQDKDYNPQLENMYCHPIGDSQQNEFLSAVILAVAEEHKSKAIRVVTSTENKRLCEILYSMGLNTTM